MSGSRNKLTWPLLWATLVNSMSTLQFGFHLAVFNAPQDILSCRKSIPGPFGSYEDTFWGNLGLRQCINMSNHSGSIINAIFTMGGLIASIFVGSHIIHKTYGRKQTQQVSAILFFLGSAVVAFSNNSLLIYFGRYLNGLAAGSCMVMAPILVSELAPVNHRGFIGSLLQFGVAIGILGAQLIAFAWSNDQQWRNIFFTGSSFGFLQFLLLSTTVESPKWLVLQKDDISNARDILETLRPSKSVVRTEIEQYREISIDSTNTHPRANESRALLESQEPQTSKDTSIFQYISGRKYRKECMAVTIVMTAQQLCGMNAITFYGVSVLSDVVPEGTNVLYLTSSLALTNVLAALLVSPLIDKWGRKPLLLLSMCTMTICSLIISYGLGKEQAYVAALGCFGFVVGYSVGLGQIPFLMVSELSSAEIVSMAQSYGTATNWLANICVALLFQPLSEFCGSRTFYIFAIVGALYMAVILLHVPETKGKSEYREVWNGFE